MDHVDQINSVCRRLHEVEGLLRFNKMEKVRDKWEMTNMNLADAILEGIRRDVSVLNEELFHLHNKEA